MITSGSAVAVRAQFKDAIKMQLRYNGPGTGDTFLNERAFNGSLSGSIPVSRNGRYTVYIKGWPTGQVYDTNTFTVRIPPARPSGVSASASGSKVTVSWNLGLEDDLTGYSVGGPGVSDKSGGVGAFCSGTSCSATLTASSAGSVAVSVRAMRSSGTGGSVASSAGTARATVSGGSGGSGGGGGGNVPAPTYPSGTTPPPGNTTPLTPFNDQSPVTLPSVQPPGSTPGFIYPTPQIAGQAVPKASNAAASSSLQWGKSVGIAMILLVVAAHLGTWTRRLRVAQAGVSDKGMAARMARAGAGRKRVSKAREHIAAAEAMAKTATLAPAAKGDGKAKGGKKPVAAGTTPAVGLGKKPADGKKPTAAGSTVELGGKGTDGKKPVAAGVKGGKAGAAPTVELDKKAAPGDAKAEPGKRAAKGGDAAASGRRRPATLGKRSGGVNVQIAKDDQSARASRGRRRRDK
ncbi:hypothetical protein ACIBF1_02420 [Spirillospora sp. NPDC050679]